MGNSHRKDVLKNSLKTQCIEPERLLRYCCPKVRVFNAIILRNSLIINIIITVAH